MKACGTALHLLGFIHSPLKTKMELDIWVLYCATITHIWSLQSSLWWLPWPVQSHLVPLVFSSHEVIQEPQNLLPSCAAILQLIALAFMIKAGSECSICV